MNLVTFSVDTTNIFPCTNTTKGGQYVTEFNLKSRESVGTDENIKYTVGPSYVHGEEDFYIGVMNDATGYFPDTTSSNVSSSILKINDGRGVIDGYFVESLAPIMIDLTDENAKAIASGEPGLSGKLCIGLRIMYSTESAMAGSIATENENDMYEGIHVVILPESEFKLPIDEPNDRSKVTAHILLATFEYNNGRISNIKQNYPGKCRMFDASRISNINVLISDEYLKKSGLNYKKLYTFAGKGTNPEAGLDTWCDTTDSLMVWDNTPEPMTDSEFVNDAAYQGLSIIEGDTKKALTNLLERYKEAKFESLNSGEVGLIVPHKQIDYPIYTSHDEKQLYPVCVYKLPVADFISNTPGTVDSTYTKHVKDISKYIENFYHLTSGKQRAYIPVLNDRSELPELNQKWNAGDYILVGEDNTSGIDLELGQSPSSMYVILPGIVTSIMYSGCKPVEADSIMKINATAGTEISETVEVGCFIQLRAVTKTGKIMKPVWKSTDNAIATSDINGLVNVLRPGNVTFEATDVENHKYSVSLSVTESVVPANGVLLASRVNDSTPNTSDFEVYNDENDDYYFHLSQNRYNGTPETDYFTIDAPDPEDSESFIRYYYVVNTSEKKIYTETPIWLTDVIPLAQTDKIGGFLNVDDTALDAGYIYRDDEGHLRLLDYALLRSGTLAYQLGEDFETSSGLTIAEIQAQLDEYVNERVAFPNAKQLQKILNAGEDGIPNEINVVIHLSAATEEEIESKATTLNIHSIDSRFNTHVNLHILGTSDYNTTINIIDCERIRIDTVSGNPKINLIRSCLYYDYYILNNYLAFGTIEDMRLWYVKRHSTDANLVVDYMTVREYDTVMNASTVDFYDDTEPNDNHFTYGLQSISFSGDGTIIGCSILIKNDSTSNISEGKFIIGKDYVLPQGQSLMYPEALLRKQIKVTGQFVSAYHITSPDKWVIQNTSFTALSQANKWNSDGTYEETRGSITFLVDAFYVDNAQVTIGTGESEAIDGWEPAKPHVFYGGTLS